MQVTQSGSGPSVVPVALAAEPYDIHVGRGLLPRLGELLPARPGAQCAVVTCEPLAALYGEKAATALRSAGWAVALLVIPDGENSKSLQTAETLYNGCLDAELDRGSTLVAVGGGVVGDLTGFVAATYMRGLPFVQVPTTLLAQVDASVGGKTAVDLPRGKNLVGAFHQPALVVIDIDTLLTLPERELQSGMAEVIKHAAIADSALFADLEGGTAAGLWEDRNRVQEVVAQNCRIKAGVVAADPHEKGLRGCLNFGHTIGHAIEVAAGEWDVRHGEAVALGMVAETQVAARMGMCGPEVPDRLRNVLLRYGLLKDLVIWDAEAARSALRHDKKVVDGRLRFPVVPEIGRVSMTEQVPVEELIGALDEILVTGV